MNVIARRDFLRLSLATSAASLFPGSAWAKSGEAFILEPLPYPANALEPHLDARTMEIHHDKHHQAYVTNLNRAIVDNPSLQGKSLEELQTILPDIADAGLRQTVRNNGGGHWNHRFFWNSLAPAAQSGQPSAELTAAINAAFGSMDEMKAQLNKAALSRFGSGWAWLIRSGNSLKIVSTPNQDNPLMKGTVPDSDLGTPILGVDVWEHAYYLKFQNRRADYLTEWWNVINWPFASAQFSKQS